MNILYKQILRYNKYFYLFYFSMSKILSFDVGIKNLAYCLMSKIEDTYKIYKWGIINIADGVIDINNKSEVDTIFITNYKKLKLNELKEYMTKYNLDIIGNKKDLLYRCELFLQDKKLLKLKKCRSMGLSDIGEILYQELQQYPEFLDVEYIVIENQPVLKNPTMKSIQMILYSYFLFEKMKQKDKYNYEIKLISAKNKLKVYDGPEIKHLYNLKSDYALTKKLGIEYCKYMIKDDIEQLEYLTTHDKKDDLCDSFLQGAYFITKNIKIPKIKKQITSKKKKQLEISKIEDYL